MAWIMNVQRFSLHDGPGVRTTAFLMGCSLRCRWCHNPESLREAPRMTFDPRRCIGCRRCLPVCDRSAHRMTGEGHALDLAACQDCSHLQQCAGICPSGAMTVCGRWMEPETLAQELLRDKPFFRKDGGVTFSGGEAMRQTDFLQCCLRLMKAEGVHTCVDTAAHVPFEAFEALDGLTDLYLVDLKAFTPERHVRLTGVDNARILDNIRRLDQRGQAMWIRIPLAKGENTVPGELEAMAEFLAPMRHVQRIDLFPVINPAGDKYRALGLREERFNENTDGPALVRQAMERMKNTAGALPLHSMMA